MIDRINNILVSLNNLTKNIKAEQGEVETPEQELLEYKMEFLEMSIAALKNISQKVNAILDHAELEKVKENLTEPWLQGMIAVVENNVNTIHDFVKLSDSLDDDKSAGGSKPGLWENIRKKKQREGKKYRPAKPGDKDRPDPDQWKKLTK